MSFQAIFVAKTSDNPEILSEFFRLFRFFRAHEKGSGQHPPSDPRERDGFPSLKFLVKENFASVRPKLDLS